MQCERGDEAVWQVDHHQYQAATTDLDIWKYAAATKFRLGVLRASPPAKHFLFRIMIIDIRPAGRPSASDKEREKEPGILRHFTRNESHLVRG